MAHYVICPYCNETFNRDKVACVKVGRRYYHEECKKLQEAGETQEEKDLRALNDYIKNLLEDDYSPVKVQYQIKEFKENYNYTYSGMLKALIWYYEINHGDKEKANSGIGIVPFIYNQARQYYYELYLAQEANKGKDIKKYKEPVVVKVIIKSPQPERQKPKLFNLE